jgi:hypothetical protein
MATSQQSSAFVHWTQAFPKHQPTSQCAKSLDPSLSQTPTNKPMRKITKPKPFPNTNQQANAIAPSLSLTTQLKEEKKKKKKKISHVLFFSLSSLISNHRVFRTVHVPKFKSRLLLSLSCACNCNDLTHFFLFRVSLFPRRGVSLFFYLSYIYLSIYLSIYIYTYNTNNLTDFCSPNSLISPFLHLLLFYTPLPIVILENPRTAEMLSVETT